jgi:hypothetical protein
VLEAYFEVSINANLLQEPLDQQVHPARSGAWMNDTEAVIRSRFAKGSCSLSTPSHETNCLQTLGEDVCQYQGHGHGYSELTVRVSAEMLLGCGFECGTSYNKAV